LLGSLTVFLRIAIDGVEAVQRVKDEVDYLRLYGLSQFSDDGFCEERFKGPFADEKVMQGEPDHVQKVLSIRVSLTGENDGSECPIVGFLHKLAEALFEDDVLKLLEHVYDAGSSFVKSMELIEGLVLFLRVSVDHLARLKERQKQLL
jgi:hypothetical protein